MNSQHQESVIEQNLKILRGVPAFSHLDYDIISLFALVADRKKYSRDEIIFARGDLLSTAFIIIQGEVELFIGPQHQRNGLERLGPGNFFGYMALLAEIQSNLGACALSHCELLTLDRENFRRVMIRHPESCITIVEKLIQARMLRMDSHMNLLLES
jgi:CRP-like cAMP-binding protein